MIKISEQTHGARGRSLNISRRRGEIVAAQGVLNSERIGEQLVEQLIQLPSGFGAEMALMVDLQGPKLRLGTFKDGAAEIDTGQDFTLDGIVRLDRGEYFRMRQLHAVGVAWRRVGMPIRCGVTSVALRLVALRS